MNDQPTELHPPAADEFSLVFLPDSQLYAEQYPEQLEAQIQWIVARRARYNIQAVLHVGDVVDDNDPAQWANNERAFRLLDAAGLPYLVAIGNHDYDTVGDAGRRATGFNALFPPERYTAQPWWQGGFYEPGHSENAYLRLAAGMTPCLFLSLEFGPRPAVVDWANALLARHPDDWVIVLTHSFLYSDGTRVRPGHAHNPKIYPLGADAHDGEDLWDRLVSRHANIHWVHSGHHLGGNSAYRRDPGAGGAPVHQVFANWQDAPRGGDGWLQLATFGNGRARLQTFSPTLGQAATDPSGHFDAPL